MPISTALRSRLPAAASAVAAGLVRPGMELGGAANSGEVDGIWHVGGETGETGLDARLRDSQMANERLEAEIAEHRAAATALRKDAEVARERAERELRAKQGKQATLEGVLLEARTAAHEINNALSPILGYAELLGVRPSLAADALAVGWTREILSAANTMAARVVKLQDLVRLEETESALGPDRPLLDLKRSPAAATTRRNA